MIINPYFLVFEVLMLLLLALCVKDAWRRGLPVLWQLMAGVIFGVLLEWATIQQLDAYSYGRFLLMIGEVPISIGMGGHHL